MLILPAGILYNVSVKGICCAVPDNPRQTEDYVNTFGIDCVEKFTKMTGVNRRYISKPTQTSSDLCYASAESLFSNFDWDKSTIDALIFVSQTPDYRLPATACVLHERLGLKKDCIAFDVNLGCSGYVYGLQIAGSLLQNESVNRVLLLCGDTINSYLSPMDKSSTMLFGDAGSATMLERTEGQNIHFMLKTNGKGHHSIIVPSGACRKITGEYERKEKGEGIFRNDFDLAMDGTEVFNFTISDVPQTINEFLCSSKESVESYDSFMLHQANLFMLKHIAKKVKIPNEKLPITIDRFGNTSVASIPLTIVDLYNNEKYIHKVSNKKKEHIMLVGFGVGLSWGIIGLDIDPQICLPVIYTNDYYSEE